MTRQQGAIATAAARIRALFAEETVLGGTDWRCRICGVALFVPTDLSGWRLTLRQFSMLVKHANQHTDR